MTRAPKSQICQSPIMVRAYLKPIRTACKSYFARFQTTTTGGPPCDGVGCVHFSSSPLTDRLVRF